MKKRIKSFVSILAAIAVLVMVPAGNVLPVKAAEPVTYSLQFFGGDINQWRFQVGSTFDAAKVHMGADVLPTYLKDGDSIVVYSGTSAPAKELNLGTVKLESLTVHQNATAVVRTGGINNCYILGNSTSAINGNVTNAYLYDKVNCTFNDNVTEMTLYYTEVPYSNLTCGGTVGHFSAVLLNQSNAKKYYDIYDVSAGALNLQYGYLITKNDKYSTTPSAQNSQATENGSAASSGSSSEYDKVPKTGDSSVYLWLFCASAFCFAGSRMLRKKTR